MPPMDNTAFGSGSTSNDPWVAAHAAPQWEELTASWEQFEQHMEWFMAAREHLFPMFGHSDGTQLDERWRNYYRQIGRLELAARAMLQAVGSPRPQN